MRNFLRKIMYILVRSAQENREQKGGGKNNEKWFNREERKREQRRSWNVGQKQKSRNYI